MRVYRKVPKVTTLVTFGFSSLFLSLLSMVATLAKTCTVHGPIKVNKIAANVKTLSIDSDFFRCEHMHMKRTCLIYRMVVLLPEKKVSLLRYSYYVCNQVFRDERNTF